MDAISSLRIWIASVIILHILAFVQLFACIRFNRMRSLLIISKRFPRLVLIEAIAVVICLLIGIPLQQNILYKATNFCFPSFEYFLFHKMWSFIIPIFHFVELTEVTRLYLMSFNLHYLHSAQNNKWKSIIDHSSASKDWYLCNRHKYGNTKYVCQRMFIYYLFVATSVSLCYWFSVSFGRIIDAMFYLIGVSVAIFIYFKCKALGELNDNLLFFYEFKATAILWSIAIFLYCMVVLVQLFGFHTVSNVMNGFVTVFGGCSPSFLSTIWIPHKISINEQWKRQNGDFNMMRVVVDDEENRSSGGKLMDTLKEKEKFELFMQWIYREFSSETALCFIEIVQFKERILKSMGTDEVECRFVGSLHDDIPKSSLVYEHEAEDTDMLAMYRNIARELYIKYIRFNAEFEVNLSGGYRMKYVKLNEENWNIELVELLDVFDIVAEEMLVFMRASFTRFKCHRHIN